MKKILLFILTILQFSLWAQTPANDNCATATSLGTLTAPGPCGTGTIVAAATTVNGTLIGATPSNPYPYITPCVVGTMTTSANDVWYSFVAPTNGYGVRVIVTASGFNPNIALYIGTCANLLGGGCYVSTTATGTLTLTGLTPGQTYLIQLSGNGGQTGTFSLSVNAFYDCSICLTSAVITRSPLPVSGTYNSGQIVHVCYHIGHFTHINTNWLHGVQVGIGPGWDAGSITAFSPASCATSTLTALWLWKPAGIGIVNGINWGMGFYYDANGDGNPANNFGDTCGTNIPSTAYNFCLDLKVANNCAGGSDLSVTFNTSGDGESGSWTNTGCSSDLPSQAGATSSCIALVLQEIIYNNSFSPNGDGLNDVFEIPNIEQYTNNHMYVYNRWGQLLWDGTNYDNTAVVWEGKDNSGNLLASGTYYYIVQIEGALTQKHWVELVK